MSEDQKKLDNDPGGDYLDPETEMEEIKRRIRVTVNDIWHICKKQPEKLSKINEVLKK